MEPRSKSTKWLAVAAVVIALSLPGCSGGCTFGQKDYTSDIQALFDASPDAKDWRLMAGGQYVVPHGDKDGPEGGPIAAVKGAASGYDQSYSLIYDSKKVPRFRMQGFLQIPANDSRPFEDRATGYLTLWTRRIAELPDSEGFMEHWVETTGGDYMSGYTEDMTMSSKYPGMRVYRTQDKRNKPGTQLTDFEGREGPVLGYDTETKKWLTLEPAKPKPVETED